MRRITCASGTRRRAALFGGDLVVKGTPSGFRAPSGDVAAYIASLERVLALEPARIFPAHGPVIDEPGPLLRGYIEHRREREEQMLDALRRATRRPTR